MILLCAAYSKIFSITRAVTDFKNVNRPIFTLLIIKSKISLHIIIIPNNRNNKKKIYNNNNRNNNKKIYNNNNIKIIKLNNSPS